jgi:hypothetical protein
MHVYAVYIEFGVTCSFSHPMIAILQMYYILGNYSEYKNHLKVHFCFDTRNL